MKPCPEYIRAEMRRLPSDVENLRAVGLNFLAGVYQRRLDRLDAAWGPASETAGTAS